MKIVALVDFIKQTVCEEDRNSPLNQRSNDTKLTCRSQRNPLLARLLSTRSRPGPCYNSANP